MDGPPPPIAPPTAAIDPIDALRALPKQQTSPEDLHRAAALLRQQGLGQAAAHVERAARLVLAARAGHSWTDEVTDDTDVHSGLLRSCNDLFNALESSDAGLVEVKGLSAIQFIKRMGLAPYQDIRSIYSEEDMVSLSAQLQRGPERATTRRVHFGTFSSVTAYIET